MTRNIATRLLSVAAGLLLGPLAACNCGAPAVTCAAGTSAKGNTCVPDVTCGTGTTAKSGKCTADVVCGTGTVAQNGSCVAGAGVTCGTGTVQQGTECDPDLTAICGTGTVQQGTSCVPAGGLLTCGPGTAADTNNVCQIQNPLTCGAGTVDNGSGICLPELSTAAAASGLTLVLDAAPSPDGLTFYFTAEVVDDVTGDTSHSLFSVPADGSAPPSIVASGFVFPINIAVSTDGKTIFVADMGFEDADVTTGAAKPGAMFKVDVATGASTLQANTVNFRVRGVDVFNDGTNDHTIFTGTDPADSVAGVFELSSGGTVSAIDKNAAFTDPSGVSAISLTEIYVVDTSGSDDGLGALLKVTGANAPTVFASELKVGYPAGVTTTLDGSKALVSGIDDTAHAASVFIVDLATGAVTATSQGISGQTEAGGIHRANGSDTFAWAGAAEGGAGTVFQIKLP